MRTPARRVIDFTFRLEPSSLHPCNIFQVTGQHMFSVRGWIAGQCFMLCQPPNRANLCKSGHRQYIKTQGHGYVPINLYLQTLWWAGFHPWVIIYQSLFQGLLRDVDWILSAFKRSKEIIRQARNGT